MTDLNNRDDFSDALAAAVAGLHAAGANFIPYTQARGNFVADVTNFVFGMDEQVPTEELPPIEETVTEVTPAPTPFTDLVLRDVDG